MSQNESSNPNPFLRIKAFIGEKPKLLFRVMVVTIIASVILTTTLEVTEKPAEKKRFAPVSRVSHGFTGVVGNVSTLSDAISLKSEISLLMEKDTLSHADSLRLLEAFQKLEKLNRNLNPDKK
jgi:Mg2+/citrate symporter